MKLLKRTSFAFLLLILLACQEGSLSFAQELPVHLADVTFDDETVLDMVRADTLMVVVTNARMMGYGPSLISPQWQMDFPDYNHVMGLPAYGESLALTFTYRGKGKYGPEESGEALLSAVDLQDGAVRWSAHLPGYLPFEYTIDGDRAYLTCKRIGKPVSLKKVERLWRLPMRERSDSWIIALDMNSGELLWHAKTRYWASYVGHVDNMVFFAEQKGDGRNQKTPLVKRDAETGEELWRAEGGLDLTRYESLRAHPRGIAVFSPGGDGTISHLLHPLSGEVMGRLTHPNKFQSLRGDTLWTLGASESVGFKRRLQFTATQWNGFAPIDDRSIELKEKLRPREWYRSNEVKQNLEQDIGYWAVMVKQLPREERPAFRQQGRGKSTRVFLPQASPASTQSSYLELDHSFLFSVRDKDGVTWWGGLPVRINDKPLWVHHSRTVQDPVWSDTLVVDRAISAYDGKILAFHPFRGEAVTLASPKRRSAIAIFSLEDRFVVGSVNGLDLYGPEPIEIIEEMPEKETEESIVAPPPLPAQIPVVAVLPEPLPESEPVQRERLVEGWRVQLMFLSRTPLPRIQELANEFQRKLGLEIVVEEQGIGRVILAGSFVNRADAIPALRRIRTSGFGDAFLVRSSWTVLE